MSTGVSPSAEHVTAQHVFQEDSTQIMMFRGAKAHIQTSPFIVLFLQGIALLAGSQADDLGQCVLEVVLQLDAPVRLKLFKPLLPKLLAALGGLASTTDQPARYTHSAHGWDRGHQCSTGRLSLSCCRVSHSCSAFLVKVDFKRLHFRKTRKYVDQSVCQTQT